MQTTTRVAIAAAILGASLANPAARAAAGVPRRGDLDRRHPRGHPAGPHHLHRRGAGLSRSRQGLQRRQQLPGDRRTGPTSRSRPARSAPAPRSRSRPRRSPSARCCPNFDQYVGPPIEFGRMEATASDPDVMQQYGMTVGIPNAGQVNALGMINIRGERSTTCKGDRDTHPVEGRAAGRLAQGVRGAPQDARCARARGRARRASTARRRT